MRNYPQEKSVKHSNWCVTSVRFLFQELCYALPDLDCPDLLYAAQSKLTYYKQEKDFYLDFMLTDVEKAEEDLKNRLYSKNFYFMLHDKYYGQRAWFGTEVFEKFPAARQDIESAGNCLAFNEPTACVLHLVRALEAAIRMLSKKLRVTISPKDTWGTMLNKMGEKIQKMPEKTSKQKQKKVKWASIRNNLYHVKLAWRDDSMHGLCFWTLAQAQEIASAANIFMRELAEL